VRKLSEILDLFELKLPHFGCVGTVQAISRFCTDLNATQDSKRTIHSLLEGVLPAPLSVLTNYVAASNLGA
jgi:hypothetical protein